MLLNYLPVSFGKNPKQKTQQNWGPVCEFRGTFSLFTYIYYLDKLNEM